MICRTIDWRGADDAFAPLADDAGAALLTGGGLAGASRWGGSLSYVAAAPSLVLEARGERVFVDGARIDADPFDLLSGLLKDRRRERSAPGPRLKSGLVGYLGYEAGRWTEPAAAGPPSPFDLPDIRFAVYDAIAAFDGAARVAQICGVSDFAVDRLAERLGAAGQKPPPAREFEFSGANVSAAAYAAKVETAIERILNGDLYQANLSRRIFLDHRADGSPFDAFVRIMTESSAAYAAFLPDERGAILSASPELFFSIEPSLNGAARIVAEPIKGTRPRGATQTEDDALAAALAADPKDRAENVMIADLTRNDLSRICRDHSVREDAICALVTHAGVHHLVSRISGDLADGVDAMAALRALFPCGSITGAPKVESMRAIADIEGEGRGPYCGAIGFVDDDGAATFSVAIRTGVAERTARGFRFTLSVGGGVTLRSDPRAEYEETKTKARGLLRALGADEAPS